MHPAPLDPDDRLLAPSEDAQRIEQAVMIEPAITDAGMMRIAEEIVDSVDSKRISGDDLRHQLIPR